MSMFLWRRPFMNFWDLLQILSAIASTQKKDNTVKLLSPLIKYDKIVILAADKKSCTIILNKSDYIRKINNIIEEGMQQGKYIETIDTTQSDSRHFQDFLYRHFKKSEHYDQMRPVSNQPGRNWTHLIKHTSLHH